MKRTHKPVGKCHSCLLNLGDHCWLHEWPREQWNGRRCPSFENEEVYANFRAWLAAPNAEPQPQPQEMGSRRHPKTFRAKKNADRRRLLASQREKLARQRPEQAILVQLVHGDMDPAAAADSLAELARLADTAGASVVGQLTQHRHRPTPNYLVGAGKLGEIQALCRETQASLVIVDNELTPTQVNELDRTLGIKVIDRTELILQIFARRARTEEAQRQVELAQLRHMRTRLPDQLQPRFRGGIGMRGPGEAPLQMRRQAVNQRINVLKKELERIRERRNVTRQNRDLPSVCLVGYTNAGKSTLLNALSQADAYVDDRLFATLDTLTRRAYVNDELHMLLSDTVGFIRHLPHGLVASFRSTLEIAATADVLLLVADASDAYVRDHLRIVQETLAEIDAGEVPSLLLLNKADTAAARTALPHLRAEYPKALVVSARTRSGIPELRERIGLALGRAVGSPSAAE
jgi:GTP-binding protein HflX